MLAAVADLTGGAQTYLHALAVELKRLGLLPPEQSFDSIDGLLASLGGTSSVLAKAIDIPPLRRQEIDAGVRELRESWRTLRANTPGLPSAETLNAIAQQLQHTAQREGLSVWMLSALLGIGAFRAGTRLGQIHIFDYYRRMLDDMGASGMAAYLRRVSRPYMARAAEHLDPARTSYIEFAIKRSRRRRAKPILVGDLAA
jgi:hypothetical protein